MTRYNPEERYYTYACQIYPTIGVPYKRYVKIIGLHEKPNTYLVLDEATDVQCQCSKTSLDEEYISAEIEFNEEHYKKCLQRIEKMTGEYLDGKSRWISPAIDAITEMHDSSESTNSPEDDIAYKNIIDTLSGKKQKLFIH